MGHKKGKPGAKTGVSAELRRAVVRIGRRDARRHAKKLEIRIAIDDVRCVPCMGAQRASHAEILAADTAPKAVATRARAMRPDSRAPLRDFPFDHAVHTPAPKR